jgi:hypothetical protein
LHELQLNPLAEHWTPCPDRHPQLREAAEYHLAALADE